VRMQHQLLNYKVGTALETGAGARCSCRAGVARWSLPVALDRSPAPCRSACCSA
jgi:hypothetical protein